MKWPSVRLSEVAEINPPHVIEPTDDSVAFVPMAAVSERSKSVEYEELRSFSQDGKGYTAFLRGDLLLAKITPSFENGKVAIADISTQVGLGTTEFHVIRPNETLIATRYLFHLLRTPRFMLEGARNMTGSAGQKRVPAGFIKDFPIPLPPLEEQKRIAAILDKADRLRSLREQAIAKLDELAQSIFLEMFGDPVTNPNGWAIVPLSYLGEIKTGNTPSKAAPENYGDGIEWIKSNNIVEGNRTLSMAEERLSDTGASVARVCEPGSILVTCIAGSPKSIGKCAIADRKVACNQQINSFTPREPDLSDYYLFLFRLSKRLVQSASTKSMKGLVSKGAFSKIGVPNPPGDMKARFQGYVNLLIETQPRVATAAARHSDLHDSLVSRAFNGDLSA